jgi:hypothetical protein
MTATDKLILPFFVRRTEPGLCKEARRDLSESLLDCRMMYRWRAIMTEMAKPTSRYLEAVPGTFREVVTVSLELALEQPPTDLYKTLQISNLFRKRSNKKALFEFKQSLFIYNQFKNSMMLSFLDYF